MFYSLDMVLAIGFRVRSKRGTQFRIWANRNLKEYMVKGFLMDDERLGVNKAYSIISQEVGMINEYLKTIQEY